MKKKNKIEKKLKHIEGDIEMHDKMQKDIEANMAKPDFAKAADADKILSNYEKLQVKVAGFYKEWETVSEELEQLK